MRGAGLIRVLATTAAGAAVVAGAGVVDGRWILTGAPRADTRVEHAVSTPLAARQVVCPGPETVGVPGLPATGGDPAQVQAVAAPDGVRGVLGGRLPAGSLAATSLPGRQEVGRAAAVGQVLTTTLHDATGVTVDATGRSAPSLVAAQRTLIPQGESAALASAPCTEPTAEAWLLAGSGQAGRQEHLVLANPHDVPATVDVSLLGAKGVVVGVAGQGIVVAPHARTTVLLDALDSSESSPTAHVVVRGGTVQATLHDGWTDGIVPRGADDVSASADPARAQVVPGLVVAGEDDPAVVRVAVPGGADADVSLTVYGPQGPVRQRLPHRRVPAGTSVDLGLPALPAGAYAVRLDASAPVVASGYVGRADGARPAGDGSVGSPVHDYAWTAAAPALTDLAGLPLGEPQPGVDQQLVVTNPTGSPVTATVTLVGADGAPVPTTSAVPAHATVTTALGSATSVWLTPSAPGLRADVVSQTDGHLVTVTPLVARSQQTVPYAVVPAP